MVGSQSPSELNSMRLTKDCYQVIVAFLVDDAFPVNLQHALHFPLTQSLPLASQLEKAAYPYAADSRKSLLELRLVNREFNQLVLPTAWHLLIVPSGRRIRLLSRRPLLLQFVELLDVWVDDLFTIANGDHFGNTFASLRAVCLRGVDSSALQRVDPLVLGNRLGSLPQLEALHVHGYSASLIWLHHLVRCINDNGRKPLLSIHTSDTIGQSSNTLSIAIDKLNVSDMRIYLLPDERVPFSAARELVLRCLQMCEPTILCKVSILVEPLITDTLSLVPALWLSTLKAAQFSVNVGHAVGCQETAQQLAACPLLLDISLDLWNTDLAHTHNCERNLKLLLGAVPLACRTINIPSRNGVHYNG